MIWTLHHPRAGIMLGYLPSFLNEQDPRSAREQVHTNYISGWHSFQGFERTSKGLEYPDDPPMVLIASTKLRSELVELYNCGWVAITQEDGSFDVARLD